MKRGFFTWLCLCALLTFALSCTSDDDALVDDDLTQDDGGTDDDVDDDDADDDADDDDADDDDADDDADEISTTTFDNGDAITPFYTTSLNSIKQELTEPDASLNSLISDIRVFSFNFKTLPTSFYFWATLPAPDKTGDWKLCRLIDDVWCSMESAEYDSDGSAKMAFALDLSSAAAGAECYSESIAFIKESSIMSNVSMVENPSTRNALAALITFETPTALTPTMTLVGQDDNDIVKEFASDTSHSIDVLGLYNNYDNTVYIDLQLGAGRYRRTFTIHPEYPFIDDYVFTVERGANLDNRTDAIYINCGQSGGSFTSDRDDNGYVVGSVGIDEYGKVRWILNDDFDEGTNIRYFPVEYQGKQYLAHHTSGLTGYGSINLHDYSGNLAVYWPTALYRPHHDATMGPGNLMAVAEIREHTPEESGYGGNDEVAVVEIDLTTGERGVYMDLDEIIDPDRDRVALRTTNNADRVHINSSYYDPTDDSYVISARYQGVVKIKPDRSGGNDHKLIWWLTPHFDVAEDWQKYLLEPTNFDKDDANNWNAGQHTASIMPNGDIMMYDNHNSPAENADNYVQQSRVWVVRVDEANMTVTEIHDWRTPDLSFCTFMSSAQYHEESNTVVSGWATTKKVYESSYPDGEFLFSAHFETVNTSGNNIYRFYKLHLYE